MTNREICQKFANNHKLIFEDEGECGFGRECVGFIARGGNYLDYNPYKSNESYEQIEELQCEAVEPPDDVNAYHKHECMAVLGRGDEAIDQLAKWVDKINEAGNVKIHEFETGADDIQKIISGILGYAITAGS